MHSLIALLYTALHWCLCINCHTRSVISRRWVCVRHDVSLSPLSVCSDEFVICCISFCNMYNFFFVYTGPEGRGELFHLSNTKMHRVCVLGVRTEPQVLTELYNSSLLSTVSFDLDLLAYIIFGIYNQASFFLKIYASSSSVLLSKWTPRYFIKHRKVNSRCQVSIWAMMIP